MKTKSKRFLNLATLCLALLGTALLMGRPVNAEAIPATREVQQQTAENKDIINEDTIKKEYMARFGLEDLEGHEVRYKGYLDGYRKGFNGENMPERSAIQVPDGVQRSEEDDYRDGYEGGYGQGRHEGHPVEAFLEDVWEFFTSIFKGWFGSGDSSQ
ncbi:TPA: hypothetical protein ACQMQ0_000744 [Streptococcus pyogenes]|uniref:hypothetical protein n=1 Tax=Streptococcus pyogenes TaxID=1314 RepID=UPI0010A0F44D|nr:hypothetical protein [Streptococcus pyogenes]QCK49570.1 hypothetical protein ETT59_07175 [Streptococcus pyogenes]VGR41711.1 hypothetical membrane associated protein [Streptococcus pyogenes]VHF50396.1 Uncharacterised protein [Streptococcus pyogenes]VHF65970.1 Uncharacterised protein [Streptococcus pyogenes]VHG56856.1 Uncharacterised protein [Streptococcus pyogenes]